MEYLLIVFVVALALAPLTHFLPSKRQRQVARMREYAAVNGLFVEFRNLPARGASAHQRSRPQQVIYYGRRLPPSRGGPRGRCAWLWEEGGWVALDRRADPPPGAERLPANILALSVDEGSCGAYWNEVGESGEVQQIIDALQRWAEDLGGGGSRA